MAHKVKQGETLSSIAKKYGLSLAFVLKLNSGLTPDMIKEGQVIILSKKETDNDIKSKSNTSSAKRQEVATIISKFTGGNIDISKVHDLASVAEYTGLSEGYIRDILVGLEGKNKWPLCNAEYDGVKDKIHPKGYLTIGFGHTSLAGEPKVVEGMEISEKQAFQILANDIINAVKLSRNKLKNRGLNYDTIPTSIQCAIVDIVFNKGPSEINESLVANLDAGYYGAAARRTWFETPNVGLQKRNMFRFIEAISSLDTKTKKAAISKFKQDHETQLLNVFKKDINAKMAWNEMCNNLRYKEGLF